MKKILVLFCFCCLCRVVSAQDKVYIIPADKPAPVQAKRVGKLTIGNNTTKINCHYENDIRKAMQQARGMGGNIIKITKVDQPSFIGSCYRFQADVLHIEDNTAFAGDEKLFEKWLGVTIPGDTTRFALLYVYMLPPASDVTGSFVVHDDEGKIGQMSENMKRVIRIYKEGPVNIWARTEKKESISFDVKYGQSYYLKCYAQPGNITGIPGFKLMPAGEGEKEYDAVKD